MTVLVRTLCLQRLNGKSCISMLVSTHPWHKHLVSSGHGFASKGHDLPTLTLYTKEECSLCDEAKEVLRPFWHRFSFEEVDITLPENKEWFDSYKYEIPVFHLNGIFLMKHRVNTKLLDRKLKELEGIPES